MIAIPYALDALNFLAADVRNLFGPFVNEFLVTVENPYSLLILIIYLRLI